MVFILAGLALLGPCMTLAEELWLVVEGASADEASAGRLRAGLPSGWTLSVQRMGAVSWGRCAEVRLVLVEGEAAAMAALHGCPQARVWAYSLPMRSLESVRKGAPGRLSGIGADPPLARQVAVLATIAPRPRVIAVPYSPASAMQAREAEGILLAHGFQALLLPVRPDEQPLRPLREVLADVQAVLALPDPALYHEGLLRHWLLMTAREGVPMVGGLGRHDVRRGVAAAAVQPQAAAVDLTLRLLPRLVGDEALPPPQVLEDSQPIHNPFMLERLGLRLEGPQ
ncbi:MAG: hypothetical protein ACOZAQ_00730 [Pseudomonadota bacterium]